MQMCLFYPFYVLHRNHCTLSSWRWGELRAKDAKLRLISSYLRQNGASFSLSHIEWVWDHFSIFSVTSAQPFVFLHLTSNFIESCFSFDFRIFTRFWWICFVSLVQVHRTNQSEYEEVFELDCVSHFDKWHRIVDSECITRMSKNNVQLKILCGKCVRFGENLRWLHFKV